MGLIMALELALGVKGNRIRRGSSLRLKECTNGGDA